MKKTGVLEIFSKMSFPLYDVLYSELPVKKADKNLSKVEKTTLVKYFQKLSQADAEIVFAIIYIFHQKHKKDKRSDKSIYNGEVSPDGISFDIDLFPPSLQQILYIFMKKNHEKQKEERNIQKDRQNNGPNF